MSANDSYRYCPYCGAQLEPFKDHDLQRKRCPECGWVHYRNPTVGVAVVMIADEQVLLGQRKDGNWCIPCGHVEWDEDVRSAARREALEEIGVEVALQNIQAVHSNFHNPEQHTVGIWFLAEAKPIEAMRAGGDLTAINYFPLDDLPTLAFPTDRLVLTKLLRQS